MCELRWYRSHEEPTLDYFSSILLFCSFLFFFSFLLFVVRFKVRFKEIHQRKFRLNFGSNAAYSELLFVWGIAQRRNQDGFSTTRRFESCGETLHIRIHIHLRVHFGREEKKPRGEFRRIERKVREKKNETTGKRTKCPSRLRIL